MKFRALLFACTAAGALVMTGAITSMAYAGDKITQAPAPGWVKPFSAPSTTTAPAGAPVAILLNDVQAHFTPGASTFYSEFAFRIQTAQGLPAGQFAVEWDPATDNVVVNKFQIQRGNQTIDVLAGGQSFTIVRRETNLDRAMLDGVLTGVLQPEGLQVGDVITYAYTRTRKVPELGNHAEGLLSDVMPLPSGRLVLRAVWDKSVPVQWKASDDLKTVQFKHTASGSEVLFDVSDYSLPKAVDQAPVRDQVFAQLQFSDYKDWAELSATMSPLYDKAATLAPDSPLRAEVVKIQAASPDPAAQASAALRLVENNVRYVFLGMNQAGIVPADADTTWTRRFGDCKGKSALLLALLHQLGIKAEPALVSTTIGDGLDQRLPMAELFDHVIVRTEIGGKVYWLDGTRYGDNNIDELAVPDYHWALPLQASGGALEALTVAPLSAPLSELSFKLDASAGIDVPARVHGEHLYRGDFAVQLNAAVIAMSPADLDKALKAFWTDDYDWLTPKTVSFHFDPAKREILYSVDGDAKMDWAAPQDGHGRRYEADGYDLGWNEDLKRDPGPHQHDPVTVSFPIYMVSRETIILPDHGKNFNLVGEPVDKTLDGTVFHRSLTLKDGVFTMEASSRSLVPEISYDQAMKDQPDLTAMAKGGVYIDAPFSYKATDKELAAAKTAGDSDSGDAATHLTKGQGLLAAGQYQAALAELDQALKLKPDDVDALLSRGGTRLATHDFTGALADFDAALKIDPINWRALNGHAQALGDLKRYPEAIDAFSQSLELQSDNDYARRGRILAYWMAKQPDKALADARLWVRLKPESPDAFEALATANFQTDHRDAAIDALRKAVALSPDTVHLMTELAQALSQCFPITTDACQKERDEAVTLYDKIIALEPTADAYTARSQARRPDQFDLKKQDIDAALAMQPGNAFALTSRASLYLSQKDYDHAIADATTVIDLPEKADQLDSAYQVRAAAYEQQKKYDLALKDWDSMLALHADNAGWLNGRCWFRATHNIELDKALADCNAALKITPDSAQIIDSRAFTELRMGQLDAALTDYDAALKHMPTLADSLYGRGIVKLRKGMTKDGQADLAAARKIYPGVDKTFAGYGVTP